MILTHIKQLKLQAVFFLLLYVAGITSCSLRFILNLHLLKCF
jgi:hypothetical protein